MKKSIFSLLFLLAVHHLAMPVMHSGYGAVAEAAFPNLAPYSPPGWSDSVVVADSADTTTDSGPISGGETVYVSWAVANFSAVSFATPFRVSIYLDGQVLQSWNVSSGMNGGYWINNFSSGPYPITGLCAGTYTIKLVADSDNAVTETDETDNDFSKTITVVPGNDPGIIQSLPTAESCPAAFGFQDLEVVASGETRTFSFLNAGNGNLDITGVSVGGPAAEDYSILIDSCSEKTLPPVACGGSCTVTVLFSPLAVGARNADLTVSSSDLQTPLLSLALNGTGLPARGDINNSGLTDMADVISALQVAVGGAGSQVFDLEATVSSAGVGLEDAVYGLQKMAMSSLPVQYELVKITTAFGEILIWLYDQTPGHRDNFVSLARQGFYDGLIFHRVIDGFMIQGGDPLGTGIGGPGYTLPAEFDCSFTHVQGAVAAARTSDSVNPEKRSSGSQFYIVENETGAHSLDQNYTVFGQVISGIEAVVSIGGVQTDANDKPLENVVMTKVEVITLTADELVDQFGFSAAGQ